NAGLTVVSNKIGTPDTSLAAVIDENLDAKVSEAGGGDSAWSTTDVQQALAALSIGADIGVPKNLTWVIARIDGTMQGRAYIVKDDSENEPDGLLVAADFRNILGDDDAIDTITGIELIDDGNDVTITA